MNTEVNITEADFDKHFEDYEGGFSGWVHSYQRDTLDSLYSSELDGLANDAAYSIRQNPEFRNIDRDEARDVALAWLNDRKDDLIMEIGENNEDVLGEADADDDGAVEALADIFDDLTIIQHETFYSFDDGQFMWVGRAADVGGELLEELQKRENSERNAKARSYDYLCQHVDPVEDFVVLAAVSAQLDKVVHRI